MKSTIAFEYDQNDHGVKVLIASLIKKGYSRLDDYTKELPRKVRITVIEKISKKD